jgi:DNA helicase II / ATP-dependent DNA helicase PcrA
MGYASLPSVFQYNDSFSKKSDKHIAFFVDRLEPAFEAYEKRRFGEMFAALDTKIPQITGGGEKSAWSKSMARLAELRKTGTVTDVIEHLRATERPRLPDDVVRLEDALKAFDPNGPEEKSRRRSELEKLHVVKYREIINLVLARSLAL